MIEMNPEVRPKASDVYHSLFPYENSILELEVFAFTGQQQYPQTQYQRNPQQEPYSINRPPNSNVIDRGLSPQYQMPGVQRETIQYKSNQQNRPY